MKQIIGYSMAHVPIPLQGFCKLTLNDGTVVELRGKGTLRWNDIVQYRTLATEIEVGKKCTSIEGGFYSFTELTKITIPSSVTSITQSQAPSITAGCSKLEEINFDGSCSLPSYIGGSYGTYNVNKIIIGPHVTSIDDRACAESHITSITIPSNVKSIGRGAFYNCQNLTSITIPDSISSIGGDAFNGTPFFNNMADGVIYLGKCLYKYKGTMPENTEIVIADETTSISGLAFKSCTGLVSIIIPDSVTSIGEEAFRDCFNLTSVNIPNSITSIGYSVFYNCNSLTSVTIPSSVISIGEYAFYGCSGLTSVTIPNSVTSIGSYAFQGCSGLTSVTIPNSVTSIGASAFEDSGLTSVTIPSSVTSISVSVFSNCNRLTSVTIGNNVTSISHFAFRGCSSLDSITSLASTAPTIQSGTFRNVKTNGTLTVPVGSTGYEIWMQSGNYYLGQSSWTKVEQ